MSNQKAIREIINLFEKLKTVDPRCGRILCSTCGGYGTAIRERLTLENHQKICDLLRDVSPDEFREFGVWTEILRKISPHGVLSVYEREAKTIDLSDIRSVDRFLFYKRWNYKDSSLEPYYISILNQAIPIAIKSLDYSLVESLVIILGEETVKYPDLLSVATQLSKDNNEMKRVLYNSLRESVASVRGYVGEGITVDPSVQPWY